MTIRVKCGNPERSGTVNITLVQYRYFMKLNGGKDYVTVITPDGEVDFRIKYLREVEES